MAKQAPFFVPRRSGTTQKQVTTTTTEDNTGGMVSGPEPKLTTAQVQQDDKDNRAFLITLGAITVLILVILYFIYQAAIG